MQVEFSKRAHFGLLACLCDQDDMTHRDQNKCFDDKDDDLNNNRVSSFSYVSFNELEDASENSK